MQFPLSSGMDTAGSGEARPGSDSPPAAPEPPQLGPGGQRPQRRTEPGRSSSRAGRRSSGGRGGDFLCPSVFKPLESVRLRLDDREEPRRRHQQQGVLSDSENEEPITRRIRTISAFIRKTTTALSRGGQRSRSCTDPVEDRGKLKVLLQPTLLDPVGALTAGVLLSSENSRSASVPILPPRRRLAWSAVVPQQSSVERCGGPAPGGPVPGCGGPVPCPSERSASPDSNDSISEELNHFKPIVCSPCTPPKRLPDGRTLQPRIIKATPRDLRHLPPSQGSWFHTSATVLQKWRQIELDRQTVSAATGGGCTVSVATHSSPVNDSTTKNSRHLLFDAEETVRIKVPALHPQDHGLDGLRFGSTSKRKQKPKGLEAKRSRPDAPLCGAASCGDGGGDVAAASSEGGAQERSDRALALQLQRRFDSENSVTDPYFLRSTNQSTGRAEGGRGLRSARTNRSADRGRSLRSSRRSLKRS